MFTEMLKYAITHTVCVRQQNQRFMHNLVIVIRLKGDVHNTVKILARKTFLAAEVTFTGHWQYQQ